MVAVLDQSMWFPPPGEASPEGLLAVGGDLSIERIRLAYESGVFPWPLFGEDLLTWFSPDPRAILELDSLHISRSLQKVLRKNVFQISFNRSFNSVIQQCAASRSDRPSTWITQSMLTAYEQLHKAGIAHSVEVWLQDELVGGLYGVSLGGFFAGESMFSRQPNASKVALVHLVQHLRSQGFQLLDVQQRTPHLVSMGATEVRRTEFLARLRQAVDAPVCFVESSEIRTKDSLRP